MSRTVKMFLRILLMIIFSLVALSLCRVFYQNSLVPLEINFLTIQREVPVYGETKAGKADLFHRLSTLKPGYRYQVITGYRRWDHNSVFKLKLSEKTTGWVIYDPNSFKYPSLLEPSQEGAPSITPLELDEEMMKKI